MVIADFASANHTEIAPARVGLFVWKAAMRLRQNSILIGLSNFGQLRMALTRIGRVPPRPNKAQQVPTYALRMVGASGAIAYPGKLAIHGSFSVG